MPTRLPDHPRPQLALTRRGFLRLLTPRALARATFTALPIDVALWLRCWRGQAFCPA